VFIVIRIVTGKINSGKTTRLIEIYLNTGKGGGIIAKKYMDGTDVVGFNAVILGNDKEYPYLIHEKQLKKNVYNSQENNFIANIGPYRIFASTQTFINDYFDNLCVAGISPQYFDEVGKLEIMEKGYYQSIKAALKQNIDIYLTVREDLIEEVMNKFEITDYEIISR